MTIFNIYIFNRVGNCVYYHEWSRRKKAKNLEDEQQLLFGMLRHLTTLAKNIAPKPGVEEEEGFTHFKTTAYKLHYFHSPSKWRIVLNTDPTYGDLRPALRTIYELIVDHVVLSPLYEPNESLSIAQCATFVDALQAFCKKITIEK